MPQKTGGLMSVFLGVWCFILEIATNSKLHNNTVCTII